MNSSQAAEEIVKMCNVTLEYNKNLLPVFNKGRDSKDYLTQLCIKGLQKRLNGNIPPKYKERLDYELSIINKMNYADYFLIVWDYVKYAKQNNILVGPGRGSAAGSLVSYTLGITDIDPLKYNLLFERFLNPERITMPDIDMDFDASKRQQVIDYCISKYGVKNVSGIITFDTLTSKQVIRDISRVMDIPLNEVDIISNMIDSKYDLTHNINNNTRLSKHISQNAMYKKLFNIALKLENLPRNTGVHASGIVICPYEIDDYVPLYKKNIYLSGYKMDYLEKLGLLKMDFLAINNLTLIDKIITSIRNTEKINITMANIPINDIKTFL